jgi:hypothetical protein
MKILILLKSLSIWGNTVEFAAGPGCIFQRARFGLYPEALGRTARILRAENRDNIEVIYDHGLFSTNPQWTKSCLCFFQYHGRRAQGASRILKDGFDRGEKATHIVAGEDREEYLKRLGEADINVEEMMASGQLEVLPWTDMYVRDHRFDQDAMLDSVEALIQSGAHAGYARTKLVGHHMDWLFIDKPAVSNLVEYEARLNLLLSKYDSPVMCNYDLSKFGASVAIDIMRTHPLVIIGGLLRENPFFVPPDQFLRERHRNS